MTFKNETLITLNGKTYRVRWRNVIILILSLWIIWGLFFGKTQTEDTPYGSYQCKGNLIQVCGTDSKEVRDYINP